MTHLITFANTHNSNTDGHGGRDEAEMTTDTLISDSVAIELAWDAVIAANTEAALELNNRLQRALGAASACSCKTLRRDPDSWRCVHQDALDAIKREIIALAATGKEVKHD